MARRTGLVPVPAGTAPSMRRRSASSNALVRVKSSRALARVTACAQGSSAVARARKRVRQSGRSGNQRSCCNVGLRARLRVRCLNRGRQGKKGKQFFFEKKNQKTFVSAVARSPDDNRDSR